MPVQNRIEGVAGSASRIREDYIDNVMEFCNKHSEAMIVFNIGIYGVVLDPIFATILITAMLIHEGGHYAAQRYYDHTPDLYVFPLVGAGVNEPYKNEGREDDISNVGKRDVFLAGPAASLITTVICAFLFLATGHNVLLAFVIVFTLNDIFNNLPIWKLDGGRAKDMWDILAESNPTESKCTKIAQALLLLANISIIYLMFTSTSVTATGLMSGIGIAGF